MNIDIPLAMLTSTLVNLSITHARLTSVLGDQWLTTTYLCQVSPIWARGFPRQYWHLRLLTAALLKQDLHQCGGPVVDHSTFLLGYPPTWTQVFPKQYWYLRLWTLVLHRQDFHREVFPHMKRGVPQAILTSTLVRLSLPRQDLYQCGGPVIDHNIFMSCFPLYEHRYSGRNPDICAWTSVLPKQDLHQLVGTNDWPQHIYVRFPHTWP